MLSKVQLYTGRANLMKIGRALREGMMEAALMFLLWRLKCRLQKSKQNSIGKISRWFDSIEDFILNKFSSFLNWRREIQERNIQKRIQRLKEKFNYSHDND